MNKTNTALDTQPQAARVATRKPSFRLGVVNNYPDSEETRLFLTPEACGLLVGMGVEVCVEAGAGIDINYTDMDYADNGARMLTRGEVLGCDVVLSVRSLTADDAHLLRKGATLLTLYDPALDREAVQALIDREVTLLAIDRLISENGTPIFARILDEIDGRAALVYAQEGLSFLGEGKGVLICGMPGLQPCEVLIIGQGTRAIAAAKAAIQLGARVTLMDNDIASLQDAMDRCGPQLITSSIHPHVLYNDIKHADIILLDACTRPFRFPEHLSLAMKQNVYLLDLMETTPSLVVPRTVAMAISNVLINFFADTLECGGIRRMVRGVPGVRAGLVTYRGHLIDKPTAIRNGMHALDLGILLTDAN